LGEVAFGSGAPEHLAESWETGDLAEDDAVQSDLVRRQNEIEKPATESRQ